MQLINELKKIANPTLAQSNLRFFKQSPDSYCKDDIFLGITMPNLRKFLKQCPPIELEEIKDLMKCEYNEARILAWWLLERDFKEVRTYYDCALEFAKYCGNWNVVDNAAPICTKIFIKNKQTELVEQLGYDLFKKDDLWSVRFSIVLSLYLIKNNELNYGLDICEKNLQRREDMIRKPIGWMLREIGKKDKQKLVEFIQKNINEISSISLSYALEHFSKEEKTKLKMRRT